MNGVLCEMAALRFPIFFYPALDKVFWPLNIYRILRCSQFTFFQRRRRPSKHFLPLLRSREDEDQSAYGAV